MHTKLTINSYKLPRKNIYIKKPQNKTKNQSFSTGRPSQKTHTHIIEIFTRTYPTPNINECNK